MFFYKCYCCFRFFTSPFELPADMSGSRSWLLAGLLGQQREVINEEGSGKFYKLNLACKCY